MMCLRDPPAIFKANEALLVPLFLKCVSEVPITHGNKASIHMSSVPNLTVIVQQDSAT